MFLLLVYGFENSQKGTALLSEIMGVCVHSFEHLSIMYRVYLTGTFLAHSF